MAASGVVIVGGGLAGFQSAVALREMGYADRIVLVCDEAFAPYHRPPLSKGFLLDETDEARLAMRPVDFFAGKNIELILGRRVAAIDRVQHRVTLDDNAMLNYRHLILAVGARNRLLPVPGANFAGVCHLRTLPEAQILRERLREVNSAVVIGAGFIGLEFAMSAIKRNVEVTVLDVMDRPMARALSPTMSAIFTREHEKCSVKFAFKTQANRVVERDGDVSGVETTDGRVFPAELVVVGIGVEPNVELAAACGLQIRNGIVVDEQLLTEDPYISAVGDCAAHPNVFADGAEIRLESVQNATDQARCVAARLSGKPLRYTNVPWFWSDQGALKLQIAGVATHIDQSVLRGDPAGVSCANFCFRGGRLLAVETLNRPADHMAARRLLAQHVALTPAEAADEGVDLKKLLAAA